MPDDPRDSHKKKEKRDGGRERKRSGLEGMQEENGRGRG